MQDQQHITIHEALAEFESVINELEKEAIRYNKRISATEEMWGHIHFEGTKQKGCAF